MLQGEPCPSVALVAMENMCATILIVEDHAATRNFLVNNLRTDGYELLEAACLAEARMQLERGYPDLAILDLGLPDGDGLELVRHVRAADRAGSRLDPELPMLVLTGRGGELDRLRGFDRGCDDYVVKPFSYQELHARTRALLRRTARRPGTSRIRVGPLEIDVLARTVWVSGEPVSLSNKEFALLRALAADPTRVFTREELLRGVWGFRTLGSTRTLDSHAFRLRRKLAVPGASFVVNVWGVGYRLVDGRIE
jgi:DNA-binding response OmpR family regulator